MPSTQALPRPSDIASQPSAPRNGASAALPSRSRRRPSVWAVAAGVVVVTAVAVAALLLLRGDSAPRIAIGQPTVVSSSQLTEYAHSHNGAAYWAGPAAAGFKLELTEVRGSRVFVRYLTSDAKAGDPRAAFTTVATYPTRGAYQLLRSASSRPGAVAGTGPAGATTLYYKQRPTSVYVARPGANELIEVFAPQPRAALQLAQSQSVIRVR
jgi:hypothetical protein